MYNKYLTQTINEYNKIMKCIETSESADNFIVCSNMRDLFTEHIYNRLYSLYKSKNWFLRKINSTYKYEIKHYNDITDLMILNLDNILQNIYQDINEEQEDQIRREKRQMDIISESQAYRDGYKPHVVVTGFK